MISVRIVLNTHPSLVTLHCTHWAETQQHTAVVVATIGQALRGGHEKSVVGKKFRLQFGNDANLEMLSLDFFVQALHVPRSTNSSGVYRPKYKKKTHFSLVSFSVYTRSRRGAERIREGEGRWSRPPKTALERSDLTENSSSENPIPTSRRKKNSLPNKKENNDIYIYIY